MFIETLWASMLAVLGLFGLYVKFFKPATPLGGMSRYRNYRKERREAFLMSLRRAVLKKPYIAPPEKRPGLHPGKVLLI